MVDKRGLGGLGGDRKPKSRLPTLSEFINPFALPPGEIDYLYESGLLRPDTPRQPSLQDRLPPGWATEGPWRQNTAPPSPMVERMLEEEGLPMAIPGGPPPVEREQLVPRAWPQPIGYRRRKPKRPKVRESGA